MITEHVNRIPVHLDGKTIYDIVQEDSFDALAKEISALGTEKKKICIIADSNVSDLYLDEVTKILSGCCREVTSYVFPAGEENKNLKTVQGTYEHLILNHYDRKDLLVALGGGVTGDLCGFVAATYLRGVDFVQIPTTLLSQVDSGIGGKTGVDFDSYKNMVGAFHMPKLVYTKVSVLRTLPDDQFSGGMGEVIKHGLILDKEYFDCIPASRAKILAKDADTLKLLIQGSDFIKREVVEIDPTEQNERATLNFGHTLGHAIEKLKNFTMLHGHCVGLGGVAAARISCLKGTLSETEADDIKHTMLSFDLPTTVDTLIRKEELDATKSEKKI